MFDLDHGDVQGLALHGYRSQPFACYHLLSFCHGQARQVVSRLVTDISSAAEPRAEARHQLALTASGLRALTLPDADLLQFSREFRQGMAHPERALALGDVADASPEHWQFGGPNNPLVDALCMTFARSQAALDLLIRQREALFERFGVAFRAEHARLPAARKTNLERQAVRQKRVPLGEFLLGQPDMTGECCAGPFVPVKYGARPMPFWSRRYRRLDFGQNGSYLVLRKLTRITSVPAAKHAELAALHARRALGPTPTLGHDLQRRSRHCDAGLLFIALNADIRRQFEFVQQSLFNAPDEAGAVDPLVGHLPGPVVDETRHSLLAAPRCARMFRPTGGAYFFLPGIRALNYLAEPGGG